MYTSALNSPFRIPKPQWLLSTASVNKHMQAGLGHIFQASLNVIALLNASLPLDLLSMCL